MTYTGLELFLEKLKHMIYSNDNPLISNHPSILSERPQFQLLYENLESMIQTLFSEKENDPHELQEIKNLKNRFKDVAQEAHDRIDHFVSLINVRYKRIHSRFDDFECSLNLEHIMESLKSIKKDFISMDDMKMDLSTKTRSPARAGTSSTKKPLGRKKSLEEIVVGLDHDVEIIRDKLVEDQKQLDMVSIVGMGGLGKTTLATKVFNDRFVVYHFSIRAWVTVTQTFEKQDVLIKILASIGAEVDREKATKLQLRKMMHKSLMGNRYLIVIDDIWNTEDWDYLKICFPNNHTRSRILLTSRLKEVALHAKADGFIHQLEYLTDEESWQLLRKKVFVGNDCPNSLIETGKKIAKSCQGLPLAVVAIAGVLAKEAVSSDSWERIARNVTSYVVSDPNRRLPTKLQVQCKKFDMFMDGRGVYTRSRKSKLGTNG